MNKFLRLILKLVRHLWLPLTVVFIGLSITFFLWQSFCKQENANIERTLKIEAESIQNGVEVELRERIFALERMADRWANDPRGTSPAAWENDAGNYFKDFKGFQAVQWVDTSYHIRWVNPLDGNQAAVNLDLTKHPGWQKIFDTARENGQTAVLHNPRLAQGGRGVAAYCPIGQGETFKGFIVGVFRVEKLFGTMLNPEIAKNYDILVKNENETIYKSGGDFNQSDFAAIQLISFTNDQWQMEVSPKKYQIALLRNPTDEIALFSGLLFSALLGLAVHFAQRARRKTTSLRIEMSIRQKVQNEQKQLISILDASEERLKLFVKHTPSAVAMLDCEMRYVLTSERWLTDYKLDNQDITGRSHYEVFPDIPERWKEIHRRGIKGEILKCDEDPFPREDGLLEWLKWEMRPWHDNTGEIGGIIFFTEIITERKRMEQLLRNTAAMQKAILNSANYSVISTSTDGTILTFNKMAEELLGYTAEEVIGRSSPAFIHDLGEVEERARELSAELGQEIEPGFEVFVAKSRLGALDEREWTYIHKDGTRFPVMLSITALQNEKGHITGFLGVGRDITERKKLEAQLIEAHDAALESTRLKSEFLANMSHEIRTPMNGIIGMTDLLLDTNLDSEQFDYTDTIKTSGDALLNVINDILDFSKIEAGKLDIETIDFDLLNLVENVVELFAEQTQRKKIELLSLIESDVPHNLLGDPGRIRQILTNLIGNGVKFTEKGEVSVYVSKLSETDKKVSLRFSVKDTGIGISPKAQKSLFQAFMQADGSTTRKYGGTGLGLAITKQLVELMNGQISVGGEEGIGSEFCFTLELEKQSADQINEIRKPAGLKGLKVLIVDDNLTNRKVLSYQTKSWKMLPTEAENGVIALETLKMAAEENKPFDLAILDLMMPIISGFDLAKLIKDEPLLKDLRLIIMPSYGQRGDGEKARELGINGYLVKPVRQANLFDSIAAVMGEKQDFVTEETKGLAKRPTTNENNLRSQHRILIAEDNEINQRVTRLQLERLGYQVDVVADGNQALTALSCQAYSLVLMDCQMPVMDGYTATAEIRRREHGTNYTPVIALTANAIEGEREKCRLSGMDDYISKPFRKDLLIETIERNINFFSGSEDSTDKTDFEQIKTDEDQLIDLEVLAEITDHDPQLRQDLLELYVEQTDDRINQLSKAVETKDFGEIYRLAHTCLGSSATLGMTAMVEPLRSMEKAGKNADIKTAVELNAQLQFVYVKLNKQLRELLVVS